MIGDRGDAHRCAVAYDRPRPSLPIDVLMPHVSSIATETPFSPDPQRWPDVAHIPPSGARAILAELLIRRIARRLSIRVVLPDGAELGSAGQDTPTLRLKEPRAFYRRLASSGLIGFGESYQAGEWDCDDLVSLLRLFADRIEMLVPHYLKWLRHLHSARRPVREDNSIAGAERNIRHHYDLPSELFALFLDETMTYSAAMFEEDSVGAPIAHDDVFSEAQHRKIDRLLDETGVKSGTTLLEIGTGWGELAIRAALRGASVRTITNSTLQYQLARKRISAAGVSEHVEVDLIDYRKAADEARTYDAILCVEMIEAVGEKYWPVFLKTLDQILAPSGRIGLQAITMSHRRLVATRHTYTWIQKYIFPGGIIPSLQAIEEVCRRHTSLGIVQVHSFGPHYAQTLRLWRDRFGRRANELPAIGLDRTFQRTWNLYLAYCEAGFSAGYLDAQQIILTRPA